MLGRRSVYPTLIAVAQTATNSMYLATWEAKREVGGASPDDASVALPAYPFRHLFLHNDPILHVAVPSLDDL